jgi:hypothetical protein
MIVCYRSSGLAIAKLYLLLQAKRHTHPALLFHSLPSDSDAAFADGIRVLPAEKESECCRDKGTIDAVSVR